MKWNGKDYNADQISSRNHNRYEFRKKQFHSLAKLKDDTKCNNASGTNCTAPSICEEISIVLGPRPSFYSDPIQLLTETIDHENEFTRSLDTGGWR